MGEDVGRVAVHASIRDALGSRADSAFELAGLCLNVSTVVERQELLMPWARVARRAMDVVRQGRRERPYLQWYGRD